LRHDVKRMVARLSTCAIKCKIAPTKLRPTRRTRRMRSGRTLRSISEDDRDRVLSRESE